MALAPLLAALLLAAVHIATPGLRFLGGTPRSVWLSVAGGVSVAYVFVHLLPELAEGQAHLARAADARGLAGFAERHVYLVALLGLAAFYGLDRLALVARARRGGGPARESDAGDAGGAGGATAVEGDGIGSAAAGADDAPGVFWVHIASFAAYNALVGYLLTQREDAAASTLGFFAVAMALHFVVADYALHADHRARFRAIGRWLLAVAVLAGWVLGTAGTLPPAAIAAMTAFLAGGVILNVLKEEVPSERRSRFWAFAGGMAGYAALLLTVA